MTKTATRQFDLINPSNGEIFTQIRDYSLEEVREAIQKARHAFDNGVWSQMRTVERGIYLKKIAQTIRDHAKELAELETQGCGKTSKQSTLIDVPTAAETFDHYSAIGDILDDRVNQVVAPVKSITVYEPIGVVSCIIPWNYPLIMFGWKVAPALAAGNTVVFKPSRLGCAAIARLADLIALIGLPEGVFNIITTTDADAAEELVTSPFIDMVSFTGGTETGRHIMRLAATTTKKVSLELGGKSPNIVFADCDREAAIGGTMSAIFMNQGQMCTAGSRLLIEESIYEDFLAELIKKTKALKIGDARKPTTDFGPVVSAEHRDRILQFIEKARGDGARVVCGGTIPQTDCVTGFFIEPTILTGVHNVMSIVREEVFGPVLAVMKFRDEDEAVHIANDSQYGLAAAVWTKDLEKANRVGHKIHAGTIWINTYGSFPNEASFGGYKQSGFGRALGVEGLLEYTQTKHMCIDRTPGGRPLVSGWF